MDRPDFITVPLRGRNVRVNPGAIAYLQPDALGMAVIHFVNGAAFTALISVDWVEAMVAGRTLEELEAEARKKTSKPAPAKAA